MRLLQAGVLALVVAAPSFAEKAAKPTAPAGVVRSDPVHRTVQPQEKAGLSKRILAQQQAMKALPLADGEWRGPSKKKSKDGWVEMLQTQRVSTLLNGTVRVIESKGFEKSGEMTFEAFAIISFDPDARAYSMRSYSNGRVRDYPLKLTSDGFGWDVKTGSDLTVRYANTMKNGVWKETATRIPSRGDAETYLEFSVMRTSPAALWSAVKSWKGG